MIDIARNIVPCSDKQDMKSRNGSYFQPSFSTRKRQRISSDLFSELPQKRSKTTNGRIWNKTTYSFSSQTLCTISSKVIRMWASLSIFVSALLEKDMNRIKGILYAAVSSATFGLAPFFSISLLAIGYSSFEVLTYRWGVATVVLLVFAFLTKCDFHIGYKDFKTIFGLSLLRALTSFSLVIAYQNIASGVASIIHFMYPLAVAVTMAVFFREKKSIVTFAAIVLSLVGASLLSSGNIEYNGGNRMMGLIAACISVFSYAGYIIGIRKTRAVEVNSTVLTCYVMGLGALFFLLGGLFYDEGVRLETNVITWLYIGGLALPATAISNITLVKAVKLAGPTLTSLLGALEPLTAVLVGVFVFKELFTTYSALGIILVVISVSLVLFQQKRTYT